MNENVCRSEKGPSRRESVSQVVGQDPDLRLLVDPELLSDQETSKKCWIATLLKTTKGTLINDVTHFYTNKIFPLLYFKIIFCLLMSNSNNKWHFFGHFYDPHPPCDTSHILFSTFKTIMCYELGIFFFFLRLNLILNHDFISQIIKLSALKSEKLHVTLCWPPAPFECYKFFEWPLKLNTLAISMFVWQKLLLEKQSQQYITQNKIENICCTFKYKLFPQFLQNHSFRFDWNWNNWNKILFFQSS